MPISVLEEEVELAVETRLSRTPPIDQIQIASALADKDEIPVLVPIDDEHSGLELLLGGAYFNIKLEEGANRTLIADVDLFYFGNNSVKLSSGVQHQNHHHATITRLYNFEVPSADNKVVDDFYILEITGTGKERIKTRESNFSREPFPLCGLTESEYLGLKSLLTSTNTQEVRNGFNRASELLRTKINYEFGAIKLK